MSLIKQLHNHRTTPHHTTDTMKLKQLMPFTDTTEMGERTKGDIAVDGIKPGTPRLLGDWHQEQQ